MAHPIKAQGQEQHWGDSGTCSFLVGTTTASSPPAAGAGQGHSRRFCHWHFAGILQAVVVPGSYVREAEEQAAIAAPQAGSHCPCCEGRVFRCNNYPCTTGSPVQFLFTYLSLHVQTKTPTVWLCFGKTFHFSFQPPTSDRLSFGLHHLCSKCHLPSQRQECVDAVFHEQCGARTACT